MKKALLIFVLGIVGFMAVVRAKKEINLQARHIAEQQAYITELENRTVTEQMRSIQHQVGCKKIDADPGPETRRLVNAKVKAEEKDLFNQYAAVYIEAPEMKEETK